MLLYWAYNDNIPTDNQAAQAVETLIGNYLMVCIFPTDNQAAQAVETDSDNHTV